MSWLSSLTGININLNKTLGLENPAGQALEGGIIGSLIPGVGTALGAAIGSGGQATFPGGGGAGAGLPGTPGINGATPALTSLESTLSAAFGGPGPSITNGGSTTSGIISIPQTLQDIGNAIADFPATLGTVFSGTLSQLFSAERDVVLSDAANLGIYAAILIVALVALWALLAPSNETVVQTAATAAKIAA